MEGRIKMAVTLPGCPLLLIRLSPQSFLHCNWCCWNGSCCYNLSRWCWCLAAAPVLIPEYSATLPPVLSSFSFPPTHSPIHLYIRTVYPSQLMRACTVLCWRQIKQADCCCMFARFRWTTNELAPCHNGHSIRRDAGLLQLAVCSRQSVTRSQH